MYDPMKPCTIRPNKQSNPPGFNIRVKRFLYSILAFSIALEAINISYVFFQYCIYFRRYVIRTFRYWLTYLLNPRLKTLTTVTRPGEDIDKYSKMTI